MLKLGEIAVENTHFVLYVFSEPKKTYFIIILCISFLVYDLLVLYVLDCGLTKIFSNFKLKIAKNIL